MDDGVLLAERLRSHRLTAPAATAVAAAEHMLATQAQEFWGGRWALAARARGEPALAEVDAAFDRGDLVRSWTQRGTVHVLPARDLAWVLSVTGARQFRQAASRQRQLGLDEEALRVAERAVRGALRGRNRLTRAELMALLGASGVDPSGQRGVHVLYALSVRAVVVQGPVVPRAGAPTREQYLVLCEEWVSDAAAPPDPLAEFFVRYIDGHGPATAADFAWCSGLPIGMARRAAEAAADRVSDAGEGRFVAKPRPRRAAAPAGAWALPPFDEYFLSYADRTTTCPAEHTRRVLDGGAMRPILVVGGRVVGTWQHSLALNRLRDPPSYELLDAPDRVAGDSAASAADITAALHRYRRFLGA
jgi:hypothetical protein